MGRSGRSRARVRDRLGYDVIVADRCCVKSSKPMWLGAGPMIPSSDSREFEDIAADVVRAWEGAGARYGAMDLDWENYPPGSRAFVSSFERRPYALPSFSFSCWEQFVEHISSAVLTTLPIPESPFGISFKGGDGCKLGPERLGIFSRFRDTLHELELWGLDIHENDL